MFKCYNICIFFLSFVVGGMDIVELNERCRILCYLPGQKFPAHKDGNYIRPAAKGSAVDSKGNQINLSCQKFQVFLLNNQTNSNLVLKLCKIIAL